MKFMTVNDWVEEDKSERGDRKIIRDRRKIK